MPDDGTAEGLVTKAELAELAELFDTFEFAFDPLSTAAKEAESRFDDRMREIFESKVAVAFPRVGFAPFCCKVKSLCRQYLKKNTP